VTVVPEREEKDILTEILESTRNLAQRMRALETKTEIPQNIFRWKNTHGTGSVKFLVPNDQTFAEYIRQTATKLVEDGFSPEEIKSYLLAQLNLPDSAIDDIYRAVKIPAPKKKSD
jgi:uncharacterized surface protein with fasciclin (FAS1) repeats